MSLLSRLLLHSQSTQEIQPCSLSGHRRRHPQHQLWPRTRTIASRSRSHSSRSPTTTPFSLHHPHRYRRYRRPPQRRTHQHQYQRCRPLQYSPYSVCTIPHSRTETNVASREIVVVVSHDLSVCHCHSYDWTIGDVCECSLGDDMYFRGGYVVCVWWMG